MTGYNKMSAHFFKPPALELPSSQTDCCAEDAAASTRIHGHLPIDAGAVIGDAGERKHRPGSFMWASFFSSRDIGQVHFSNMK